MIVFKKLRYKNYLSVGNNFVEIELDQHPTTLFIGTNGTGKSTMISALCFVLFNKTFRRCNKPELLNSINQKELVVEIEFQIGQTEYFVRRGMKPNIFEIYENDQLVEQTSTAKDYQTILEKSILRCNYKTFTQVVILGSGNYTSFMKLPAADRRTIVENLLDINIFSAMNVVVGEQISDIRSNIESNNTSKTIIQEKIDVHQKYLKEETKKTKNQVKQLKDEISTIDSSCELLLGQQEDIQKQVKEYEEKVTALETELEPLEEKEAFESKLLNKIKRIDIERAFFEEHERCPTCEQDIEEDFKEKKIDEYDTQKEQIEDALTKIQAIQKQANAVRKKITGCQTKISTLQSKLYDNNSMITSETKYKLKLEREIKEIEEAIATSSESNKTIIEIERLEKEKAALEKTLNDLREQVRYLEFIIVILKDTGIKSEIVRQYLPTMNRLINEYLEQMNFFVQFELNEQFDETIKSRYRDQFSYDSFSEGEKLRIDLALLLTWRAIAAQKNSITCNLLVFDELFDTSLDADGIQDFVNLMKSFINTNTIVISHKSDEMIDHFDRILKAEKKGNFTQLSRVD